MTHSTDIIIVGGGLNGCALAISLASIGLSSLVIDRSSEKHLKNQSFDGRAYSLAHATKRMLNVLGIWSEIERHCQPILDIKVSTGTPGKGAAPWFVHFDHAELEEGPMGFLIEDRFLRSAFLTAISASPLVEYLPEMSVDDHKIEAGNTSVTLSNGEIVKAKLIVGCDGRNSSVAERAGIVRHGWQYDQTALVCALEHEHPHLGTAHQFFTPSGPLAILPLPKNRCSIVWTEKTKRAEEINDMFDEDYLAALTPVFGDFLGKTKLSGSRFSYPLSLSLANSFYSERLVLVGDAAHGIHPMAGQGLNLGLKDVAALTQVLAEASRRGEDVGAVDVLQRYEKWRRFDTVTMAAVTDGLNHLFSNDNTALNKISNFGLGMINSTPKLRRGFMRHAAGLSGELPKLLKGQLI